MSLNACELKIDLLCRGVRVPGDVSLADARGVTGPRAGLGSGLEVVLPAHSFLKRELWVNVPVVERFASASPYRLTGGRSSGYLIIDERSFTAYPVGLPAEPQWYSRRTSREIPMNEIGVLQGTGLAISINAACVFWNYSPPLNCLFCTTGRSAGANEPPDTAIADVIEACWAAREETGATFVHLNGGFHGSRGLELALPYVRAIKERVGMLVGVHLAPERDFRRYDELIDAGVDYMSFCLEFLDPQWFARICPGKARVHGQQLFLDAMKYCAERLPNGAVSGEIIAGIEPFEKTCDAIDLIIGLGASPTVCIFRPTIGSEMENWPSPSYDEMRAVMVHVYQACQRHRLPVGSAPNNEISLVVTPDDAALLVPRNVEFCRYELFRKITKALARPLFRRRLHPPTTTDAGPASRCA